MTAIGTNMSLPEVWKYWTELAKNDPVRFISEKKAAVEEVISQASEERRQDLRELQSRIDAICVGDPLASSARLQQMMCTQLDCLSHAWLNLSVAAASAAEDCNDARPNGEARIISRLRDAT